MNSSHAFAPKILAPLALAILTGCGSGDGRQERLAGDEAYERGDFRRAAEQYAQARLRNGEDVDVYVGLALAHLALGELDAAQMAITEAETRDASSADVRELAAQIAWHLKDYAKAERLYRGLANDTKLSPSVRAAGWTGLGVVEMANGRAHPSRLAFLRAIRLDRRYAPAWYHLGLLYRDAPFGYNEAALEQLEIYVRLTSNASPRVQKTQRTHIPALKDTIARALTDRAGASRRDSSLCAALVTRAEGEMKKAAYKAARGHFEAALKADVLSFAAANGLAKAWEKSDASRDGQLKALECYTTACALRPTSVTTLIAAADLATRLGQNARSIPLYSRAVAANPASVTALDGLIRALRKTGDAELKAAARDYQLYRESLAGVRRR